MEPEIVKVYSRVFQAVLDREYVVLDTLDCIRTKKVFEVADRARIALHDKKTQLAQAKWDYEYDSSDDGKIDLREEMMILEEEIETLEGILNG